MYPTTISDFCKNQQYIPVIIYFTLHSFAIYLFVTAGDNPGWVDENEDLIKLNHYKLSSEEEDEENTSISRSSEFDILDTKQCDTELSNISKRNKSSSNS